jgi:hypothetical protein
VVLWVGVSDGSDYGVPVNLLASGGKDVRSWRGGA